MLKIEKYEVMGFGHAIRGMRNPMNSWEKSDSCTKGSIWCGEYCCDENCHSETGLYLGPNDHQLMMSLAKGGPVHAKYRRMITVYLDITAPLYWWKEFDTYKVGTVANSCSTMHKIHAKEFTLDDFSCEHLMKNSDYALPYVSDELYMYDFQSHLGSVIDALNFARRQFLATKEKQWWWQMIQLLPTSYNQKRTVMLNYEVLHNIYHSRRNHKLDEWHVFCDWIEKLPYSEIITG